MTNTPTDSAARARRQQGFSLIELLLVAAIIGIIAAIGIPNLLASRRAANEASAISSVRNLSSIEEAYRATFGNGRQFASFSELLDRNMIDSALATATTVEDAKSGYMYALTLSGDKANFCAGAAPASPNTGVRNFSSNAPGVIFEHPATVAAPPTTVDGGSALRN